MIEYIDKNHFTNHITDLNLLDHLITLNLIKSHKSESLSHLKSPITKLCSGKTTDIGFIAKLLGKDLPPKAIVKFNGKLIHNELDSSFYYVRETKPGF